MVARTDQLRWPTHLGFLSLACVALTLGCGPSPVKTSPAQPEQAAETSPTDTSSSNTTPPPAAAPGESAMSTVPTSLYGKLADGTEIKKFSLTNQRGMQVDLINFGATLISVLVPDANGEMANVTLSFPDLAAYEENKPYFGGICGRYANRIANGKFSLDGKDYQVATNNGSHHLHGGIVGFNRKVWQAEVLTGPTPGVKLTYVSPDGEEGYPGTLTTVVTYTLNDDNALSIDYQATTDRPTVLNVTNHAYWNLSGDPRQTILDHVLTLDCDRYIPVDEGSIPTGELASVSGTAMDFLQPHRIGERIGDTVNGAGGYDHCYVVNGELGTLRPAARIVHEASGRIMEVSTTEPGVQLYTGNYLDGTPATGNAVKQGAFCLEAQHFPDSPHFPDFPTTVLNPGETYRQTTVHRFSIVER